MVMGFLYDCMSRSWLCHSFPPLLSPFFLRPLDIVLREAFRQQKSKHFFGANGVISCKGTIFPLLPTHQPAYLSVSYRTSSRLDDNYHHRPSSSHRTIHNAKQAFPTNPLPYHTHHTTHAQPHTNNHKRRFLLLPLLFPKRVFMYTYREWLFCYFTYLPTYLVLFPAAFTQISNPRLWALHACPTYVRSKSQSIQSNPIQFNSNPFFVSFFLFCNYLFTLHYTYLEDWAGERLHGDLDAWVRHRRMGNRFFLFSLPSSYGWTDGWMGCGPLGKGMDTEMG